MGNVEFGIGYLTVSAAAAPGFTTKALRKKAPNENMVSSFICTSSCFGDQFLSANDFDILWRHRIAVIVAEMSPQIIHNGGNLVVAHHGPEGWHSALAVDDNLNRISAGFEVPIGR